MKKSTKMRLLLFTVVMGLWTFIALNFRVTTSVSNSYYNANNAPEFYGLTKAVIKKGDVFSLQDTKFRIFAKDFEDGDVTNKIESSNNVDTSVVGSYEIHYAVTDSHNNTTYLTVPIEVVDEAETPRYYERTLYTLPSVWNLSLAGTNRGNNHDRQMIGFYLNAGAKIRVKKVSGGENLSLSYSNNDSQTEKGFTITGEYTEVTHNYGGVPFVRTSYNRSEPVVIGIEVDDQTGVSDLVYHHENDSEVDFFNKWRTRTGEYGVLDSNDVTILVPYADKDKILYPNQVGKFSTLDEIYKYYHYMMDTYDEYLGLSFNPTDSIDQNVRTKYFIKANAHGAGAAYYSGDHVGINSASIYSLFEYNWGTLHEVAHGYQGSLAHSGIEMGEVSNNILGHYIQMDRTMFKSNADWLGSIPSIEEKYNTLRKQGKVYSDYNSYGYQGQLYIFVNLLDTFNPKESYAKINQIWRRNLRDKMGLTTPDAYALAFYELYNVNVSSYFESFGIPVSLSVKEKISGSDSLYFLKDMIGNDQKAEEIRKDLNKQGLYSLVRSSDVSNYELTGTLNVIINIDDINQIMGKNLVIQNSGVAYNEKITSNTINLEKVSIGSYEIVAPIPKDNIYDYSIYTYVNIVNNQNTYVTIEYKKGEIKTLKYDTVFDFKGLGDSQFATLSFDNNGKAHFVNRATQPHVYFSDSYASVKIVNSNGYTLFEKNFIGNVTSEVLDTTIDTKVGDKIIITHREAGSRLVVTSSLIGKKDEALSTSDVTTTYIITSYGLVKENTSEDDAYSLYKDKVEAYAAHLSETLTDSEKANKSLASIKKRSLLASILELKDTDRYELSDKYKNIYNGSNPNLNETTITVSKGATINVMTLLKGVDTEDGTFDLNAGNFYIDRIDTNTPGTFKVGYILTDLDGNKTIGTITLVVNDIVEECPEPPVDSSSSNTNQQTPVNKPSSSYNENTNSESTSKPTENKPSDDKKEDKKEDKKDKYTSKVEESKSNKSLIVYIYLAIITILLLIAIYLRAKKRQF